MPIADSMKGIFVPRPRKFTVLKRARITSKGQITIPRDIRRILGVRWGDSLLFDSDRRGIGVSPMKVKSRFERYRGIGNPGITSGRKRVVDWVRELHGK